MEKVYFIAMEDFSDKNKVNEASKKLLAKVDPGFSGSIPLKIHFGEKGNITFIKPENYEGIIEYLKDKKCEPFFTDTNVLYKGSRTITKDHLETAKDHGFTQIPVRIADEEDKVTEIKIKLKHFDSFFIGKRIADAKQMLVISHFKGHMMAGFGGAIKQLAMGCANRRGKLAMHAHAKPILNPLKCTKCMTCTKHCPVDACIISKIPHVDKKKCIGCAMCIAVCPSGAMTINWLAVRPKTFNEMLAEYAFAAQKDKEVTYISFATQITKHCDCEGTEMKPIAKDLGLLASRDPIALDQACLDLIRKQEGKKVFSGEHTLEYGEEIGLGSRKYELITLD
ncbi:MAG: DUF362 domain-containing protein [Candidatus Diapherotrites archaeon]|jgi:uncharacterized protein|nr:DUF362 domain-containing protein [Candidatus Diapherotrites archaeon]MBT4597162.1 DUF362 domain-containing protein [Candidatus Diapherotrites archaeon]